MYVHEITQVYIYIYVHNHIILLKICTRTLEYFFKCTYVNKFNLEVTFAHAYVY